MFRLVDVESKHRVPRAYLKGDRIFSLEKVLVPHDGVHIRRSPEILISVIANHDAMRGIHSSVDF